MARYRWDKELGKLVELGSDEDLRARGYFITDAAYQNLPEHLNTRAKHHAYMREHGLTLADDFKETWAKNVAKREAFYKGEDPKRKAQVSEVMERVTLMPQARYDRECAERARRRGRHED